MRLPFMKPKNAAPAVAPVAVAADADDIETARLRARRRLVGALVLLIAGVIAFPLVFETQPRPIGAQTTVEPGAREVVAAVPAAPKPKAVEPAPVAPPPDAGIETAPAASTAATATPPAQPAAPVVAPVPVPAPPAVPPASTTPKAAAAPPPAVASPASAAASTSPSDSARAKALLEGAPSDSAAVPGSGRFIVQVGAYASLAPMKEVRAKVEKLGMKTYTQVIENADGKRTRLRVGPFGTRAEAEAAAAKLKAAGLPGNLLSL